MKEKPEEKDMKTEKIIISFIAILIGILFASVAFYFYQSTKTIPQSETKIAGTPTPTSKSGPAVFLAIDSPKNEEVVNKKTINIVGKTIPEAIVVISTENTDEVIKPVSNGNFSTTAVIDNGVNKIEITAIAPNGEETKIIRTVTFSTENF